MKESWLDLGLIVLRWGSTTSNGTIKDCEALFGTAHDAREFHGQLIADEKTTYISMEMVHE